MRMSRRGASALAPYAIALGGVAAMSLVIGAVIAVFGITRVSILYLIVVLAAATRLGRGPAVAASLAAFLLYDWFFTEPYHQLTIRDPEEWISLGLFLVTAVITSELAANERRRAEEAERREREAVLLFDALRLMSDPDLDVALRALAERVRSELGVLSAAITFTVGARTHTTGTDVSEADALPSELLGAGRRPTADQRGGPARWIRVVPPSRNVPPFGMRGSLRRSEIQIRSGSATVGHITVVRPASARPFTRAEDQVLALIAASLGSVAQRAELRDVNTRAEILRRTDELKSALLAAVSHDLRTPLASIIASAGSLRQPDVQWTDVERREFVTDIETEARRLGRIVDNLLDLSRMEAGALRPERSWYDLAALVDDVVGRLRPSTVGHDVVVDVPEDLPPVRLDYVEIDQVLSNLIENAARHTPTGTAITIRARAQEDATLVEVIDDGPGIDPRALPHLFDAFFRGTSRGRPGVGLGLAVARGLVEAHGGAISARNLPGGGAAFRFTLPHERGAPAPSA